MRTTRNVLRRRQHWTTRRPRRHQDRRLSNGCAPNGPTNTADGPNRPSPSKRMLTAMFRSGAITAPLAFNSGPPHHVGTTPTRPPVDHRLEALLRHLPLGHLTLASMTKASSILRACLSQDATATVSQGHLPLSLEAAPAPWRAQHRRGHLVLCATSLTASTRLHHRQQRQRLPVKSVP